MSDAPFSWLPGVLAEIAEVADIDAALRISQAKGGSRNYFPLRAADGHWLVELVGREAADKICAHFGTGSGGMEILIPKGAAAFARQHFYALRSQGVLIQTAARLCGIHERSAFRWEKQRDSWGGPLASKQTNQLSLFTPLDKD